MKFRRLLNSDTDDHHDHDAIDVAIEVKQYWLVVVDNFDDDSGLIMMMKTMMMLIIFIIMMVFP